MSYRSQRRALMLPEWRIRLKKRARASPKQFSPFYSADVYPGFGSFRSEVMNLLPSQACLADFQALDFFIEVTMPGIDVANEMFNNTGAFHFMLPNLVGLSMSNAR